MTANVRRRLPSYKVSRIFKIRGFIIDREFSSKFDFYPNFRFISIENIDMNLFLGCIVLVVRIEGPVGVIEREIFVLPPVDISAAIRCL